MRPIVVLALAALTLSTAFAESGTQGAFGRPDAPAMPTKGDYKWEEPRDWTPLTLEELALWEWKPGRVVSNKQLIQERYGSAPAQMSIANALSLRNDTKEANLRILSALSQPPATENDVDWDAAIQLRVAASPATLSPVFPTSDVDQRIELLIYFRVFGFDYRFVPHADSNVVRAWKTNPLADMITLREDLLWEDGTPITAYDIEFSYQVSVDDRITPPQPRSETEGLKWVKAYDAHTVVFFHKRALPTNVWNLGFPVVPKHVYSIGLAEDPTMRNSEWNVYWNQHPLSGGLYKVVEYRANEFIQLERRPNAYLGQNGKQIRERPYFKAIRFVIIPEATTSLLAFKKGELDECALSPQQWVNETEDSAFQEVGVKLRGVEWTFAYIAWNMKPIPDVPYFKDKRVRWAMSYALDHKEMLEKLYFGLYDPGTGEFHSDAWMADRSIRPLNQDLDRAEALLNEAGWVDTDSDGVRDKIVDGKKWQFAFNVLVTPSSNAAKSLPLLKENLENIGVVMNIQNLDFGALLQMVGEHRFEAVALGSGTGTDPATKIDIWKTDAYRSGGNTAGYSNPDVDKLFEEGALELDRERRARIYAKIHKLIWEDQPRTWLYFKPALYAYSKRLRGYDFSPRTPYLYDPGWFSVWVPKDR